MRRTEFLRIRLRKLSVSSFPPVAQSTSLGGRSLLNFPFTLVLSVNGGRLTPWDCAGVPLDAIERLARGPSLSPSGGCLARRMVVVLAKMMLHSRAEAFVQRFLFQLAFGSVLVHLVFGCCLHHAHAEAEGTVSTGENACPCDHHDGHCDQPGQRQPTDNGCEGTRCEFTRVESEDTSDSLTAQPSIVASFAAPNDQSPRGEQAAFSRTDAFPRPVRLHLLHQALLL